MQTRTQTEMSALEQEWLGGGSIVLRDDVNASDHEAINAWILQLLRKIDRSDSDEYIISNIYHSLNFDIPWQATSSIREELLRTVRMKLAESSVQPPAPTPE